MTNWGRGQHYGNRLCPAAILATAYVAALPRRARYSSFVIRHSSFLNQSPEGTAAMRLAQASNGSSSCPAWQIQIRALLIAVVAALLVCAPLTACGWSREVPAGVVPVHVAL